MTPIEQNLEEVLRKNPQVDAVLLAKTLEDAKRIHGGKRSMVKFDIIIPYASDSQGMLYENSWAEFETDQ